ncbi:MAG: hypothetical protein Q9220_001274 [cf. Caloplaca sp. 1 TL-2023]
MPAAKRKQPSEEQPNKNATVQKGSSSSGDSDHARPHSAVGYTPFTIDTYQQLGHHPHDDPTRPPKLTTVVHIRPESLWTSLTQYRNFCIHDHTHTIHQYALISRFQPLSQLDNPLATDQDVICIARILEIRALDPRNVYIRVYWLYRPEEAPGGRQPYHGKNEMIASNRMEIVDAVRVKGAVEVAHLEDDEDLGKPPALHCTCIRPLNPDNPPPIKCTNQKRCGILMHTECLLAAALSNLIAPQQQYADSYPQPQLQRSNRLARTLQAPASSSSSSSSSSPTKKSPNAATAKEQHQHQNEESNDSNNNNSKSAATAEDPKTRFTVDIITSERPHHRGRKRLVFTDTVEHRMWERDVECLACGVRIQ